MNCYNRHQSVTDMLNRLDWPKHRYHLKITMMYTITYKAAPILVSVLVSGQYYHFQVVLELVKDAIQVPSTDSGNGTYVTQLK